MWREHETIQLTPKQFDLLFYFVENAGRVAKKSELLDAVWADTYIEETTLARNVSWLRKVLGQFGDDEKFIETVPKLGYRFTADVTRSADEENALIIEEQIIHHIRGEETIEFNDAFAKNSGETESKFSSSSARAFALSRLLAVIALIAFIGGGGFIVYQNYSKDKGAKAVVASRVKPFSGAPGYENSPAFSPDGRQLAYSWNGGEGDNSDIYVKLVGVGAPVQLTKTEANEHYPTFSPDGNHIAFVRGKYGETGEVIIIPSLGGIERPVARLFSGNYSISFSPDGKHIAAIDTENSKEGGQHAVYVINIETGERRRVTAPAEFLGETTPRFSPDGENIAFIRVFKEDEHGRGNVAEQDLFVVPAGGGEPRQLTFDGLIINSLAWSADGEYIYFVPVRPPDQTIARRIPASGGEQEIVSTGSKNITNIAVSPSDGSLVFAEDLRQWKIWRVPPDGQTGGKLLDSRFVEFFPKFSPDGSRIAFQTDRTGVSEIWTMDANGENLRQITDSPFPSSSPQFSPDGARIVFNRKQGENFYNYIVSAEGGTPRRLSPEGVQEDFPIWSADGEYIYFSSNRTGERNIWKTKSDGTGEGVQITTIGAYRATPTPDGKTVYFTKTGFPRQLWRVSAEGGTEQIVPEFEAAGFYNTWMMSASGVLFIVPVAEQGFALKFYDFADRRVKDAPGRYKIPPHLDGTIFTTDGNVLLCSIMQKSSQLMIADLP